MSMQTNTIIIDTANSSPTTPLDVRDGGCADVRAGGHANVHVGGCADVLDGGCANVPDGGHTDVLDGGIVHVWADGRAIAHPGGTVIVHDGGVGVEGGGTVTYVTDWPFSPSQTAARTCPACRGDGRNHEPEYEGGPTIPGIGPCGVCNGSGRIT